MQDRLLAWQKAFEEDAIGVVPSLTTFAWNYAAYMTVVKIVDSAPTDEEGRKKLGSLVLELLRTSYWGGAVLAIRRLVDKGPLHGKRGVSSIASILVDVKACQPQLSRRVFLELAGLEYDYKAIEDRYWEYAMAQNGPFGTPKELQYELSQDRHELFDFLSGVAETNRSETDLIRPELFEALENRLNSLSDVATHADVHFAHASTEFSRQGRELEAWGVEEAKLALKTLAETAELIGRWFLNSGVGDILPTAQFDKFAYLDRPLISADTRPLLEQEWDDFAEETARWPFIENEDV